jgi:hypothetical protein
MLSRRIFVQGLTTLVAGLAWRPAWAVSTGPATSVPVGVSARMSELADWWEEAGRAYDGTMPRLFTAMEASGEEIDITREDYKRWREAERHFVFMTVDVLTEPSKSAGDVILKYHAIDMHHTWRPVGHWLWVNGQDLKLCQQLEREAEHFGVAITPLWGKTPSSFAMIDGDRHSPRWAVIARWRRHGMPSHIPGSYWGAKGCRSEHALIGASTHNER